MNPNTHIYLYAKGWYKRNDIVEDLKIICAERCGQYSIKYTNINNPAEVEQCKVSLSDVILVLTTIVYPHLKYGGEHSFLNFISDIAPENTWKTGYITTDNFKYIRGEYESIKEYDYYRALLHKYLSILSLTTIANIRQIEGKELGEVNYKLFPMLKHEDMEA